jgi:HK97 family phage portal protein
MSLLFAKAEKRGVMIPPDVLARMGYTTGSGGVFVDEDSAMRHDAVWACVTRISQDVSMMPVDVVRYVNGTRQDVTPVPQIVAAPSVNTSAMDWRYQLVASWLTNGNAWGMVTQTTASGTFPSRIELLAPGQVRMQGDGNKTRFFVDNVEYQRWPVGPLWHVPAYTMPGQVLGLSPIGYHAASIGMGLTAQKFGADFLADGGHPSALIQPEGAISEPQAATLKQRFLDLTRGNREPIVFPASTKYTPIQVSPEESQFLNTMGYTAGQIIGRVYLEDPADYGLSAGGKSLTYANRSDADLARFKRRQFWVTKLQQALTDCLPRPQVVKLNTASALMMTTKERHEIHGMRLAQRTTTVNEVRTIEDESPFKGDEFNAPGIPAPMPPAAPSAAATA